MDCEAGAVIGLEGRTELDKEAGGGHAIVTESFRIGSDPIVKFMSLHTNNVGKNTTYIVKSDASSIWL